MRAAVTPSPSPERSYERARGPRKRHRGGFPTRDPGHDPSVTRAPERQVEATKSRMSTAAILFPSIIFAIVVIGVVLYLVLR
jgi:hypothetical protein